MKRIDAYNAYQENYDFALIADALGFEGFDCKEDDPDFEEKLGKLCKMLDSSQWPLET